MTIQPLHVRVPGRPAVDRRDRLLLVTDPNLGVEVAVRWSLAPDVPLWRCKACGPSRTADCQHTFAAGLFLAAEILGLTPAVDALDVTESTTTSNTNNEGISK